MSRILLLFLTTTLLVSFVPPTKNERPNIILFLVDDMGWQDTSVPFHEVKTPFNALYQTPNMERLAANGVTFTHAYTASPVCTPTRTSIMTGRNPARTRITNWTLRNDRDAQETGAEDYLLRSPYWNFAGLQPADTTLPGLLKEAGYRTIHVGKAHFGALDTPGANPLHLGFDVNIAGHAAGAPGSFYGQHNFARGMRNGNNEPSVWDVPGLEPYHGENINLTRALTIEAENAISDAVEAGQPFFMNMAHYTVHTPIMADSAYLNLSRFQDPQEAAYGSMIAGMDASLGQLMAHLEKLGIAKNTIIIFMSDNGGLSAHSRGVTPSGTYAHTHNLPLRSGKGSAYEGGIRVPMLVAWAQPDKRTPLQQRIAIAQDRRVDTPIISDDFLITLLELTQTPLPATYQHDGSSFVALLGDPTLAVPERVLGWHYPHKWGPEGPGCDPFTAIRKGPWKLIYFYHSQQWELYNLHHDISETTNLVWKNSIQAATLKEELLDWMEEKGAQVPHLRASDQRWTGDL